MVVKTFLDDDVSRSAAKLKDTAIGPTYPRYSVRRSLPPKREGAGSDPVWSSPYGLLGSSAVNKSFAGPLNHCLLTSASV